MEKITNFIKSERFKEIFRFVINGGVSFVVDYALLYVLTEYAGLNYLLSSGCSFTGVFYLLFYL